MGAIHLKGAGGGGVPASRLIIAGAGLVGGGDLSADRTLDVAANADGSISVSANDIQVGVLATDAQHGARGGGTQHAVVISAGAAGFMTGADKAKLDGVAAGASATFVGLTDGPGAIGANLFVRGNAGATALVNFDLFGAANVWTGVQTLNGATTDFGGTPRPDSDFGRDIGTTTRRWDRVRGRAGHFVSISGSGSVTHDAGFGGVIGGKAEGIGTSSLTIGGGAFEPLALFGNAFNSDAGASSIMVNAGGGSFLVGSAFALSAGNSELRIGPTSYGAFCGGYAAAAGSGRFARLRSYGSGSFLWGYAYPQGTATHLITTTSTAAGAFCAGRTENGGSHTLRAAGAGSFVSGRLSGAAAGVIESTLLGSGAFVQGDAGTGGVIRGSAAGAFAHGSTTLSGGSITGSGAGSFAAGAVTSGSILASAIGAFAVGSAGTGAITASAANAAQFGPGANSQSDSLKVGTAGLRLKGTTGAPTTPVVGDHWVDAGGFVVIRTPTAVDLTLNRPTVTGSRATGAALVSLLTSLAAMGLIVDSTTP